MAELIHDPEFWVLVAFVLAIALVVYLKAGDMVTKSLDERAEKIRAELDEARRLREEAQQMLADYQRKQRDALKETEEIAAQARADAERIGAQGKRDLETAIDRRRRMAEEKIAQAEAKALAEIRAVAIEVAMAATRQILASQLDERRRSELIDEAIQALPSRLH